MGQGINAGGAAPAVGENFPAGGVVANAITAADSARIHAGDDALAAHFLGNIAHHLWAGNGGGVDRHLIGAGQQQRAGILHGSHPAAHGEGHEADLRRAAHHIQQRATPLVGSGNVEEAQFVGPGGVMGTGLLHRIAGVDEVDEVDALDHAAIADIEAGNDADADCHGFWSKLKTK